jgi:hypothetical protein
MNHIFDDPQQFLAHLESKLHDLPSESDQTKHNLLHASAHAIRYLIESQHMLSTKFVELTHVLNSADGTWAEKLCAIYTITEAASVTPELMQQILEQEVCGTSHATD